MNSCRNWASLQSTVEKKKTCGTSGALRCEATCPCCLHVPALLAGAEEPARVDLEYDANHNHAHGRVCNGSQELFHVLVMNVRGSGLAVIIGITEMNGAQAWRALITRYAPNTAPLLQSLMSAIVQVMAFPSELTAFEIALRPFASGSRSLETASTRQ